MSNNSLIILTFILFISVIFLIIKKKILKIEGFHHPDDWLMNFAREKYGKGQRWTERTTFEDAPEIVDLYKKILDRPPTEKEFRSELNFIKDYMYGTKRISWAVTSGVYSENILVNNYNEILTDDKDSNTTKYVRNKPRYDTDKYNYLLKLIEHRLIKQRFNAINSKEDFKDFYIVNIPDIFQNVNWDFGANASFKFVKTDDESLKNDYDKFIKDNKSFAIVYENGKPKRKEV